MPKLNKCYCGAEPVIHVFILTCFGHKDSIWVECDKCGRFSDVYETEEAAVKSWNDGWIQKKSGEVIADHLEV